MALRPLFIYQALFSFFFFSSLYGISLFSFRLVQDTNSFLSMLMLVGFVRGWPFGLD